MKRIDEILPEVFIDLIEKVYKGNDTLQNKIAVLINTRRRAHGNDKIQDACNKYLDLLYDEKFKNLEGR